MVARQRSLFGLGRPGFDPALGGLRRIELGRGAWIELLPQWLHGHETVFAATRDLVQWHQDRRWMYERWVDVPRLTASLPEDGPAHPVVEELAEALSVHYGVPFDRISLAYYRDGRDSVAMHGDHGLRTMDADALVASVSVGEPRPFRLQPAGGGRSTVLRLGWGDLLVMGGRCQRTWRHGVPKVARAGPRVSIMFRSSAFDPPGDEAS